MDERYVSDLTIKSEATSDDYIVIETEDGTKLTPIGGLKKAVLSTSIFATIEDMKSASLSEADICITYGRRTIGDGGGGAYTIVYDPAAVEDGGLIHYLYTSDTLRAYLIPQEYVTPEQFGAYGDGTKDDTKAIMNAINSGYEVKFSEKSIYRITSSIILKSNMRLDFNHCTIRPINCTCFKATSDVNNIDITNINCDISYGIEFIDTAGYDCANIKISNFRIINASYSIFKISGHADNLIIKDGSIKGSSYVGIDIEDGTAELSCTIQNVSFEGFLTGVNIAALAIIPSSVNIDKCRFFGNGSKCTAIDIACTEITVGIDNIYAKNVTNVINNGVGTYNNINLNNFSGADCNTVITNTGGNGSYLTITGFIVNIPTNIQDNPYLFMSGYSTKTVLDAIFDETMKLFVSSKNTYNVEINDKTDPKLKKPQTIVNGSTIDVGAILGNAFINLNGTTALTDITNGVNGQRLLLTSDTGVTIKDNVNIILKNGDTRLSTKNSIELTRVNNKWVQL